MRKTPALESPFIGVSPMLETPTQVFSGGYCEIFKNTYFDFSNLIQFPVYNEKSQIHVA